MRGRFDGAHMQSFGSVTPVQIARDWDRLRHRPDALRRAGSWHLVVGPLDDLEQILDLTRSSCPPAAREAVLHRLITLARDDELAARLLLQRLVPDLIRIHRHRRRQHWTRRLDVGFGDLLGTGWTVIRTYNPRRRPARLVSSLVSDVEYREYRAGLRRIGHAAPADPLGFDELTHDAGTDPTVELAALVTDPTVALDDAELDLVRRLVSGRPATEIAHELGVTPRTIRNRRDRLVVRLRVAAAAA